MAKTLTLVFAFLLSANIFSSSAFAQDFSAKTDFTTGNTPYSVSFNDFNGDGKPDMVTANYTDNTFSVLMNTTTPGSSTPTFSAKTDFVTGTGPYSIAICDFNGDGKPDIVASNYDVTTVSVFFNTTTPGASTPTFSAKTDFTVGVNPASVSICDFNGDGKPDLVVGNYGNNTVSVLFNITTSGSATPTFSVKTDFTTGAGPYYVATGDFNGDGKRDIATANYDATSASVFFNTTTPGSGTPTFSAKTDFTTGTNPSSVAIRDLNGDGVPDLAVANYGSNSVSVLINTTVPNASTPTFSAKTDFATESGPYTVALGDFNCDGKPDMAATNYTTNKVSVYFNITTPGSSTPSFGAVSNYIVGTAPSSVTICDLNGDGKPDVAAGNETTNNVSVFMNIMMLGVTPASFSAKTDVSNAGTISGKLADINGDGKPDLVGVIPGSRLVRVSLNTTITGASTPTFSASPNFASGLVPNVVSIGDFNGDGKPDYAISNGNSINGIAVSLNTTTPGASTPSFPTGTIFATGTNPISNTTADINGDGKPDLISQNSTGGSISVLLNTTPTGNASPVFSSSVNFTTTPTNTQFLCVGDLNGDGKPDVAVANGVSNTVSVLLNTTPTGSATPTFSTIADFTTGSSARNVAIGDLNGDGKPDLAITNNSGNSVSVLLNITSPGASTPSFSARTDFTTGTSPWPISIGDLNGDGKPDLVVGNNAASSISVLLNTTTAGAFTPTFAAKSDFTVGTAPREIAIGDLNGDGKPDLAVINFNTNAVSVFLNTASLPLPVELASFTSSVNSNNVILNWSTTHEQNNKGFEIERNSFGTGWKKIGYVDGHGTTNTQQNYTYKDIALQTGHYNYRLKQIDYNGNFEYCELSNEVAIGVPNRYLLAQNYPNPFNPSTVLSFQLPVAGFVSLKIFDISGREVSSLVNEVKETGYYSVTFDAKNLSSGTYFYKLTTDKFNDVKKMVILK